MDDCVFERKGRNNRRLHATNYLSICVDVWEREDLTVFYIIFSKFRSSLFHLLPENFSLEFYCLRSCFLSRKSIFLVTHVKGNGN